MKAVILEKQERLVLKEIDRPICGANEVIVQVKACNICKTDVKCTFTGQRDLKYPRVLGHEIAGVIAEVGNAVTDYAVGQRVHVHPGIACGECFYCRNGLDNLCDHVKIMGFNYDGGFEEYLKIPAEGVRGGILNVIKNPTLAFNEISFIEPLACCINLQDQLDFSHHPVVIIIGGGRLGILNQRVAKALGAQSVILIEALEERRHTGLKHGFDAAFDPTSETLREDILALTDGMGADIIIPCCSDARALELALVLLRKQGQLGYFSGIIYDEKGGSDLNAIHYKEIHVTGSYGCGLKHSIRARELLESGAIDVKPLISSTVTLENLEEGIQHVKNCDGYSTIVLL
ncbi:MAG: alcohol dehydrogenase catalytic domain-containing protein [Eubacterium sp.]